MSRVVSLNVLNPNMVQYSNHQTAQIRKNHRRSSTDHYLTSNKNTSDTTTDTGGGATTTGAGLSTSDISVTPITPAAPQQLQKPKRHSHTSPYSHESRVLSDFNIRKEMLMKLEWLDKPSLVDSLWGICDRVSPTWVGLSLLLILSMVLLQGVFIC